MPVASRPRPRPRWGRAVSPESHRLIRRFLRYRAEDEGVEPPRPFGQSRFERGAAASRLDPPLDRDSGLGRCCSRTGRLPWSPAAYPRVGPGRMAVSGRTSPGSAPHRKGAAVELSVPPCAGLVTVSPVSTGCPAQVERHCARIEGLEPSPAVPFGRLLHQSSWIRIFSCVPERREPPSPGSSRRAAPVVLPHKVVTPGAARSRRGCSACRFGHRRTTAHRTAGSSTRRATALRSRSFASVTRSSLRFLLTPFGQPCSISVARGDVKLLGDRPPVGICLDAHGSARPPLLLLSGQSPPSLGLQPP